ncbi:outer membrane lipid asymmetry maintenance protein MlaD [Methylohalobius crimeensis]|uniref:outer membrane lipid asymmetry maintenance protein MlaD n=1 Tax=Methylohalobius crimeensis TaxID=244365 RepID=UPI0003B3DDB0|nr:outer membrane lipid asymmetry maintenance protein MlaD [Methylohalobius crimeensis]
MTKTRIIEIWVGLFVAAGLATLFMLAMKVSNLTEFRDMDQGYRLLAKFRNIGTLKIRAPVKTAGVVIGRVADIRLDQDRYEAVVEMQITNPEYKLPEDTIASIYTSGLLGEQYIALEPGGSFDYLKPGDEIEITQPALVLEELIGKFMVKTTENSGTNE